MIIPRVPFEARNVVADYIHERESHAVSSTKTPPRRRSVPESDEQTQAPQQRTVNGQKVVADDPVPSPLSKSRDRPIYFRHLRLLTLEDGTQVHACDECGATGSRGEIQTHRQVQHGAGVPGRRRETDGGRDVESGEDDPAGEDNPAGDDELPGDILAMSLADLLAVARDAVKTADTLAALESKVEQWRERALVAEAWKRQAAVKLGQLGFKLDVKEA